MRVTVYDVDQPDRKVDGKYTIDTSLGLPAVGDEIYLLERFYNPDRYYVAGTVRRRQWFLPDDEPARAEMRLWVQRHGS